MTLVTMSLERLPDLVIEKINFYHRQTIYADILKKCPKAISFMQQALLHISAFNVGDSMNLCDPFDDCLTSEPYEEVLSKRLPVEVVDTILDYGRKEQSIYFMASRI